MMPDIDQNLIAEGLSLSEFNLESRKARIHWIEATIPAGKKDHYTRMELGQAGTCHCHKGALALERHFEKAVDSAEWRGRQRGVEEERARHAKIESSGIWGFFKSLIFLPG